MSPALLATLQDPPALGHCRGPRRRSKDNATTQLNHLSFQGILLGPSVFGRIPGFTAAIFPKEGMAPFTLVANIGLTLYLFLVGLEIDLRFLVSNWRIAVSVASLDMAIPFGSGYAIAYGLYREFNNEEGVVEINFATYGLFVAIAIAITAFPVLCRILTSLNLLNSNVGVITLSSGIANDVVGWVLLALCVTLVNAGNGITALYVFLTAIGFALFLAFAVRPAFMWVLRRTHSLENGPTQGVVALTLFIVLASAFFTNIIGAHAVFGAFMAGLMCPHEGGFAIKLTEKIEDLIATLFLPLFFARSGLNTNLSLLDSGTVWGYVIAIIVIAFVSKMIGGTLGARLNGLFWRESATIGVFMSCKGLVELIVLNIGLQARILSTRTFTMFVVMALVTTFATTPLASWAYPPSYQQKLKLYRDGKIDWDGNPLHPEDSDFEMAKRGEVAGSLLVYLRADGLSSIFSVVKLFTGIRSSSPETGTTSGSAEKGSKRTTVSSVRSSLEAHIFQKRLQIHSIRLTELSERNSSVMRVSEYENNAANDPITKAFGSIAFGASREVIIHGRVIVTPGERFAETITARASHSGSDLVLIPWSETGTLSELPSYRDSLQDLLNNVDFSRLVEDVFSRASQISNVGVFVDDTLVRAGHGRSFQDHGIERIGRVSSCNSFPDLFESNDVIYSSSDRGETHVHAIYFGSEDDLFAVKLAVQLSQNEAVQVTVTQISQSAPTSDDHARHANDTIFEAIKSHASDLLSARVRFDSVQGVFPNVMTERESTPNTIFIVGRSESSAHSVDATNVDRSRVLGTQASSLLTHLKRSSSSASVLVVQAKSHGADVPRSPA